MKLFDLESPQTKQSQKVLESYFSKSIDFENMASSAAKSMLTKVRSLISEHRTHTSERDPGFVKLLVMERGLAARLSMREADVKLEPQTGAMKITADGETIGTANNPQAAAQFKMAVDKGDIDLGEETAKPKKKRNAGKLLAKLRSDENMTLRTKSGRYLTEDEVQQAQVVLAAQDMVDRIQDMLEDVTAMQFKDLPALSASISSTVGTNESQAFNNAASAALAALVDAVQAAKVGMETAQGTLTGQEPVVPGAEEVAAPVDPNAEVDAEVDIDADIEVPDVDIDVEAPEANSLGRARR